MGLKGGRRGGRKVIFGRSLKEAGGLKGREGGRGFKGGGEGLNPLPLPR